LIIGNSDAHGKNFSFFVNQKGIKATPFYDMLCVMMYDFDHHLAMAYGDEFNPNDVFAYQLREFAVEININYKLVVKVLLKQTESILKNSENEIIETKELTRNEKKFIRKLSSFVGQRALHFQEVAKEMRLVSFP